MANGVVIDYDNLCYALRGEFDQARHHSFTYTKVVAVPANPLEELKKFVNATNVNCVNFVGVGIVLFLSEHGPDDPSLLDYVISIGAKICTSDRKHSSCFLPLHVATFKGKPKIVRKLLDYGISPNQQDCFGDVPLNVAIRYDDKCPTNVQLCAKVLIDAGANIPTWNHESSWIHEFVATRENARGACIAVLGMNKTKGPVVGCNGKDVLRMIGRCLWGTRGQTK